MRLHFHFSERGLGKIPAVEFAQIFCDLQHLNVIVFAAAYQRHSLSFSPRMEELIYTDHAQKYDFYIEAVDAFGDAELDITFVSKKSPLKIFTRPRQIASQVQRDIPRIYRALLSIIQSSAALRQAEAHLANQEAMGKALNNIERALQIAESIPDIAQREKFLNAAYWAIDPFVNGRHGSIDRLEIKKD